MFKEAKRLGYFDGVNPAQDTRRLLFERAPTRWNRSRRFLPCCRNRRATIFAVAACTGLRRGEIEGLDWSNYRDGELNVSRSSWNGEAVAPKTLKSKAAVPVIRPLAERLEMHRLRCSNPQTKVAGAAPAVPEGPIFKTSENTPLSLHNVVNRQILPALNRCSHCCLTEGLPHLEAKECPGYERDQSIPEWQGFHAAWRGLGSNLYRLGVHEPVIQRILPHSNVSTTINYYIKTTAPDVTEAMQKFERDIAEKLVGRNPFVQQPDEPISGR